MYTLYIDTHFINLVLALFKDDVLIYEKKIDSNRHSEYTINMLNELLNYNKIKIDDINLIIVINGPGSFTGVRIGIVIAKIISFTKKIPVKVLSYLEAISLNYDRNVIVGVEDKNGVFVGEFNNLHEAVKDYHYLTNKEREKFDKEIIIDNNVNLNKVYMFMKNKMMVDPHLLKPIYVKKIEVEG